MEETGNDGRIILKYIFEKWDGSIWARIETCSGLL
jgi:hypothetical protein